MWYALLILCYGPFPICWLLHRFSKGAPHSTVVVSLVPVIISCSFYNVGVCISEDHLAS